MGRIVITGALGHIGSRFIRELPCLIPGTEVVMIDNLSTQRYASLYNLPGQCKYRFIEGDVLNLDLVKIFDKASAVINLAAVTDAASSFQNKGEVERVNYNGTIMVAKACAATGVPMIHPSSTSVYGTQNKIVDEDCSQDELQPQSPYAESKLKEERYLKELQHSESLRFIVCRLGTISGASPGMRFHTAVNKFCWQAIMGQPVTVWRTALNQKRPYLALSDAVSAVEFIIKRQLFDGNVYNVLTDNMSVKDIISIIEKHVGYSVAIQYVDTQIMNQLSYEVSCQRFARIGFESKGSIDASVRETVDFLAHSCSMMNRV